MDALRFRAVVGLAVMIGLISGYCAQQQAWMALATTLAIALPLLALVWCCRVPQGADQQNAYPAALRRLPGVSAAAHEPRHHTADPSANTHNNHGEPPAAHD